MKVNLHIERLILEGLPIERTQGPAVKAALEAELSRLISERGISSGLMATGAVPSVSADSIQTARGAAPANIGRQIARSVYGGIADEL
jgi:hypothetical protein